MSKRSDGIRKTANKQNAPRHKFDVGARARRVLNSIKSGLYRFVDPLKEMDAITFLTFVIAFIAWLQWRALHDTDITLRDTLRASKESSERQLRAYISVETAGMSKFGGQDKLEYRITLKNTGLTPAYKVQAWYGAFMSNFPPRQEFPVGQEPIPVPSVLGSAGNIHIIGSLKRVLREDENASVRDGTGAIYMFGEVVYEDAFSHPRFTRFRLLYGGPAGTRPDGLVTPTGKEGNEAN